MSLQGALAREWLELHWRPPHTWSWAMCRWPHNLRRAGIRRIEMQEILPFLDFYQQWGVLF